MLMNRIINIIIPVYKGYDITKNCIESVLRAKCLTKFELIAINDASPELILVEYLQQLAANRQITLLENQQNLGFVATVNRGMSLHTDRDVILLNSDTKVANDWLDRIVKAAYVNKKIGTVTPFSNNAEIVSYPKICQSNELPLEYNLEHLDRLFAESNKGDVIDIPTAVGFCMFIKRSCLNQVGLFDVERFGTGYGEENDFCLRAEKYGWRNVIATNVMIFHEGSVSFGEAKKQRIENASKIINRLHPKYALQVQQFIINDPLKYYRFKIDLKRLQSSNRSTYVFLMHAYGGGIQTHVYDFVKFLNDDLNILLIKVELGKMSLEWINKGEALKLYFNFAEHFELIKQLLESIPVCRFHIHHTQGVDEKIWALIEALNVPYDFTIHDYYAFCPQVSLSNLAGQYCQEPDVAGCQSCLQERYETKNIDIKSWRNAFQKRLENAQRVFVPSFAVLNSIRQYFDNINYIVVPHMESVKLAAIQPQARQVKDNEKIKVLILGAISKNKGADVVEACAIEAKQENLPLEFHLLGYSYKKLATYPKANLVNHGKYAQDRVQELIKLINPHLAWFPSIAPETYSYTLSQCMQAALPIVSSNLGAQPERLAGRAWSYIKSWQTTPSEWNKFFLQLKTQLGKQAEPVLPLSAQPTFSQFNYLTDYIVEAAQPNKSSQLNIDNILLSLLKHEEIRTSLKHGLKKLIYLFLYNLYTKSSIRLMIPETTILKYKQMIKSWLLK